MLISVNLLTKYVIHALGSIQKKVGRLNQSRPKVAPAGLGEKNGSGIPNCFRCQTFHLRTVIQCIRFGS